MTTIDRRRARRFWVTLQGVFDVVLLVPHLHELAGMATGLWKLLGWG